MAPIRLYAPESYREPSLYTHVELLFPFWGVVAKESMPYVRAAALQYQYSKEDFALVERIEDADYVVVPYSYERLKKVNPGLLARIIQEAHAAGKPLLIDGAGDLEYPIDIENSVILRVSQYRYSKYENEIAVPFPAEDLTERYGDGQLSLREKTDIPVVGFTGWAEIRGIRRLKLFVKELPITLRALIDPKRGAEHKGLLFRERALRALMRTPGVTANVTARKSYSGHVATIEGSVEDTRTQFVDNLLASDYALCVRGDANASVRFYEALSLGRIPVFLNTACVLPLENELEYRDFCVFVDWKDTDRIGDILREFHASVSPERFEGMQRQARAAFTDYLRFDAFSKHLARLLRSRLTG